MSSECLAVRLAARVALLALVIASAAPHLVRAAVLHVPSEYPDLRTAVDTASSGDEIVIADGVYTGSRNQNVTVDRKSLVIRSEHGPEYTIFDPDRYFGRILEIRLDASSVVEIEGITFQEAEDDTGGAILVSGSGVCRMTECRFLRCFVGGGIDPNFGGALHLTGGAGCVFSDCTFVENGAEVAGGAIFINGGASAALGGCFFVSNYGGPGSAIYMEWASGLSITRSVLGGNGSPSIACWNGGELVIESSLVVNHEMGPAISTSIPSRIEHCTITGNRWDPWFPGPNVAGVISRDELTVIASIIRGNCGPVPGLTLDLSVPSGHATLTCCNVDSAGIVDWDRITLVGEQVWQDPLFCDPIPCGLSESGNFTEAYMLDANSPCSAWRSPCGETIGALDVGCGALQLGACCLGELCVIAPPQECESLGGRYQGNGTECGPDTCSPTPGVDTSWGGLKARYRR